MPAERNLRDVSPRQFAHLGYTSPLTLSFTTMSFITHSPFRMLHGEPRLSQTYSDHYGKSTKKFNRKPAIVACRIALVGYIASVENRQVNLFDGILAILGGYGTMYIVMKTVLTVLAVTSPEPAGAATVTPPAGHTVVILAGSFLAAVVGGIVACLIAKRSPIKHTIALSAVALILGIMTTVTSRADQPLWYTAALIGLSIAGILLAGAIFQFRNRLKERRP